MMQTARSSLAHVLIHFNGIDFITSHDKEKRIFIEVPVRPNYHSDPDHNPDFFPAVGSSVIICTTTQRCQGEVLVEGGEVPGSGGN
jgi:hypothetical protein